MLGVRVSVCAPTKGTWQLHKYTIYGLLWLRVHLFFIPMVSNPSISRVFSMDARGFGSWALPVPSIDRAQVHQGGGHNMMIWTLCWSSKDRLVKWLDVALQWGRWSIDWVCWSCWSMGWWDSSGCPRIIYSREPGCSSWVQSGHHWGSSRTPSRWWPGPFPGVPSVCWCSLGDHTSNVPNNREQKRCRQSSQKVRGDAYFLGSGSSFKYLFRKCLELMELFGLDVYGLLATAPSDQQKNNASRRTHYPSWRVWWPHHNDLVQTPAPGVQMG